MMMSDGIHPAALPVETLLGDCEVRRTRRSGPGGQHRNKVETAVVIVHRPTGTSAEAGERRSQAENQDVAIFRLRLRLAVDVRIPLPRSYQSSPLWRSRCRDGRVAVNSQHDDFPALLAEALDVMAECAFEVRVAAAMLTCTASQLTKLLQQEPRALTSVNEARTRRGMHKLR